MEQFCHIFHQWDPTMLLAELIAKQLLLADGPAVALFMLLILSAENTNMKPPELTLS